MSGRSGSSEPAISYLICATPRSGSTLLCAALDDTGIAGHPEEHFEVLLETGQRRQPRDYFQRSNDPEVWALLDDPEFRDVLGEYGGRYAEHPARRDPHWVPPDFQKLVAEALGKGTTENGVLGTKIMWAYFRDFVRLARRRGLQDVRPCERSRGRAAQPAAVRVDAPGRHHQAGRLAVEGAPDPAVAQGLRRGRGRAGAALQLRGHRPPQAAHRRAQRRLAGLLRSVRRGAHGGGLRGPRGRLPRGPCCGCWRVSASPHPRISLSSSLK